MIVCDKEYLIKNFADNCVGDCYLCGRHKNINGENHCGLIDNAPEMQAKVIIRRTDNEDEEQD